MVQNAWEKEQAVQQCIEFLDENPEVPVSTAARQFGVTRAIVRRRLEGIQTRLGRVSHNRKLSPAEEEGIFRVIKRMDNLNLSISKNWIIGAANNVLKAKKKSTATEPDVVGIHWVDRFISRHKLKILRRTVRDTRRTESEYPAAVKTYFNLLQEAIAKYGITPDCIWNMDETGFQIGTAKTTAVVTLRKKNTANFGVPINRELVTVVEAISATGDYIAPPFLIVTGKVHLAPWYEVKELPDEAEIAVSDTGYTNDMISLKWIEFFDRYTAKKGSSEYRLLILDNHGSHHTREFLEYAESKKIVVFGLPSQLTHILQPLDVAIFSPMKHWHSEAVNQMVRNGLDQIQKADFFAVISEIRRKGLRERTIKKAFELTGIWPFQPTLIIEKIHILHPTEAEDGGDELEEEIQPSTPPHTPNNQQFSSPFKTPHTLRQFDVGWRYIKADLKEFSAELRQDERYDEFERRISRLEHANLALAVEHNQTSERLRTIEMTQKKKRLAKHRQNWHLQSGGVLQVKKARRMVMERDEEDLRKAQNRVQRKKNKAEKERKRDEIDTRKQLRESIREARTWDN